MIFIIISGTPGCGKTSVANKLIKLIDGKIISLNELVTSSDLSFEFDEERKTHIVDFQTFLPLILQKINEIKLEKPQFLIIESHFSDIIPDKFIDYIFILRCDPDELKKRLKKRNYDLNKIKENVQAEILGNCANYFVNKHLKKPLLEIDTTDLTIDLVANTMKNIILKEIDESLFKIGGVDWLEKLFQEDRLNEFFD
ncbi:MAG: adenylate kinase family protein [Promethearchaeota archaeon]|jgi:adenylate kinase